MRTSRSVEGRYALPFIRRQGVTDERVLISSFSFSGLSLKSIFLYFCLSSSRLVSVLFSDAYLPYDRSGDWVYRGTELLGLIAILTLLSAFHSFHLTYYSYTVGVSLPSISFYRIFSQAQAHRPLANALLFSCCFSFSMQSYCYHSHLIVDCPPRVVSTRCPRYSLELFSLHRSDRCLSPTRSFQSISRMHFELDVFL